MNIELCYVDDELFITDFNLAKFFNTKTKRINKLKTYHKEKFQGLWRELSIESSIKITSAKNRYKVTVYRLNGAILMACIIKNRKISYNEASFEKEIINSLENEGFYINKKIRIQGQIPDLVLLKKKDVYICEIQIGKLDRNHLYRSLEYRDLYHVEYNIQPKVILYCESCSKKYHKIANIHGIEVRIMKNKSVAKLLEIKNMDIIENIKLLEELFSLRKDSIQVNL